MFNKPHLWSVSDEVKKMFSDISGQKETLSKYKEEEILASRSSISKTQVSNIL
jgi:hypothetical protein